jgi:hypothetical protein
MTYSPSSSSALEARAVLAARLDEIARDAGLNGKQIAASPHCRWSPAKSSRLRTGRTSPSPADIEAWCRACGAEEQAPDLIAFLKAVEGMFIEWRRMERAGLRRAQQERLPLYERTHHFRSYASWLIPGLIQTSEFTAATLRAVQIRRRVKDDIDAAVDARIERQKVLADGGRRFAFLIEEAALHSAPSSAEVMAGQLGRLLEIATQPNISLGIVPMKVNRPRGPAENFWIFDAAQVNVELVSGYLTITQAREIALYAAAFTEFSEIARYGAGARALITRALSRLG